MAAVLSSSPQEPLRIVIVPWLAFGHLLPYLELAERLASRGHRVSYVSTPRNLARLPPLRAASAPLVDLVALPLPRVDGLPDGAESTNDVPDDKRQLHWKAFDGLAAPFSEFMAAACADEATRPHWIIADSFHHWVAASAVEHKVLSNTAYLHMRALNYIHFNYLKSRCHARCFSRPPRSSLCPASRRSIPLRPRPSLPQLTPCPVTSGRRWHVLSHPVPSRACPPSSAGP
jgi:hypothetical protein